MLAYSLLYIPSKHNNTNPPQIEGGRSSPQWRVQAAHENIGVLNRGFRECWQIAYYLFLTRSRFEN